MKSAKFVGVLMLLIIIDVTMAKFVVDVSNKKGRIKIEGFTNKKTMGENKAEMIFNKGDTLLLKGNDYSHSRTVLIDIIEISSFEKAGKWRSKAVMISGQKGNVAWKQEELMAHLNEKDKKGKCVYEESKKVHYDELTFWQWIEKKGDGLHTLWKYPDCGYDGTYNTKGNSKYEDAPGRYGAGGIGQIDSKLIEDSGTHSLAHRESHNMLKQFGAHNHHYDDREDYEQRQSFAVAPYHDHSYNHDHYYNNDNAKDLNGLSDSNNNNNNNMNTMLIIIVIGLLMIIIGCIGCLFSGVIGTAIGHFLTKRSNQQSYVDRYNKMNGVDEEI